MLNSLESHMNYPYSQRALLKYYMISHVFVTSCLEFFFSLIFMVLSVFFNINLFLYWTTATYVCIMTDYLLFNAENIIILPNSIIHFMELLNIW